MKDYQMFYLGGMFGVVEGMVHQNILVIVWGICMMGFGVFGMVRDW